MPGVGRAHRWPRREPSQRVRSDGRLSRPGKSRRSSGTARLPSSSPPASSCLYTASDRTSETTASWGRRQV